MNWEQVTQRLPRAWRRYSLLSDLYTRKYTYMYVPLSVGDKHTCMHVNMHTLLLLCPCMCHRINVPHVQLLQLVFWSREGLLLAEIEEVHVWRQGSAGCTVHIAHLRWRLKPFCVLYTCMCAYEICQCPHGQIQCSSVGTHTEGAVASVLRRLCKQTTFFTYSLTSHIKCSNMTISHLSFRSLMFPWQFYHSSSTSCGGYHLCQTPLDWSSSLTLRYSMASPQES